MIGRLILVLPSVARGVFWALVDIALTRVVFAAMRMRASACRRSVAHAVTGCRHNGVHGGSAIKRVQHVHAAVTESYERAIQSALEHDAASARAMFCQMEVERLTHAQGDGRNV